MRTSCFYCKGMMTVGSDGLNGEHDDPDKLLIEDDPECIHSGQPFSIKPNPERLDCPKCGDKDVFLYSDKRFVEHFNAYDDPCDYSFHSSTENCCLEKEWPELISDAEEVDSEEVENDWAEYIYRE